MHYLAKTTAILLFFRVVKIAEDPCLPFAQVTEVILIGAVAHRTRTIVYRCDLRHFRERKSLDGAPTTRRKSAERIVARRRDVGEDLI